MKYYITALNGNKQRLYLLINGTQGRRLVPNAYSLAATFETRKEAKEYLSWCQQFFKGVTDWEICKWRKI